MIDPDYTGPDRRRGGPDRRNADQRTKILLVDDHALFRVGMRQILDHEPDFDIVGEAEDGRDAFQMAIELSPDIVLLDLSLPAPGGIDTTQRIKREVPSVGHHRPCRRRGRGPAVRGDQGGRRRVHPQGHQP